MREYSDKQLMEYAGEEGLIFINSYDHYDNLLKRSIEAKGWDYSKLYDGKQVCDIVHDHALNDLSLVVVDLAQMLLQEREKRRDLLDDMKRTISFALKELSSEDFEKYY